MKVVWQFAAQLHSLDMETLFVQLTKCKIVMCTSDQASHKQVTVTPVEIRLIILLEKINKNQPQTILLLSALHFNKQNTICT